MSKKDAEITVGADATEAEKAAGKMRQAFREASADLVSSVGGAAKRVVGDLASVATSAATINFHSQHEQVKAFEADTARLGTSMGKNLETIRSQLEATGVSIGKRPAEVAAWVSAVGDLTYSFEDAQDSIRSMAELSAKTGRGIEAYRGLAVTLGQAGVKGKDVSSVLGVIEAQSKKFNTDGGYSALVDQFEAAGDAVTHFSSRGSDGVKQMTGLLAVLGKDLDQVTARRVQQGALAAISGDARGWERYLGHHIIDDKTGKVNDPAKVMQQIYDKTARRFKDPETLRAVMINNFGPELGTAMLRHGKARDFESAKDLVGLQPKQQGDKLEKLLSTDAGQRSVAEADLAKSSRDLMGSSTLLGKAADALQQFAAAHPVVSTGGAAVIGAGASMAAGAGAKVIGGLITGGSTGAATTAAGTAGLAVVGTALGVGAAAAGGLYAGSKLGHAISDYNYEHIDRPMEQRELAAQDAKTAKMKAARDRKRAERGWAPIGAGSGEPGGGASAPVAMDPRAFEEAVRRGAEGAKFTIINATGGPIGVANQNAQSASSGNQG